MIKKIFILLLLGIPLISSGCLEDEPIFTEYFDINESAELLIYLESKGDYINNTWTFSMVEAPDVYATINSNLIIDVRSNEDFVLGHIEGAVNLESNELLDYILGTDHQNYHMIVIVSSTGQSSLYYTTLLRLYGLSNVYSLQWGIASWNPFFYGNWLDVIQDPAGPNHLSKFNDIWYEKGESRPLPLLEFLPASYTIESMLEERIRFLFNEVFSEETDKEFVGSTSMGLYPLLDDYNSEADSYSNYYPVCMINEDLYLPEHPPGTILFKSLMPFSHFKSSQFLQTLPVDKIISLYGYNGQYSAAFTAYLRILGYDARSILYGYHRISYGRLLAYPVFEDYRFDASKLNNLPIIVD
ncbi:rhodanese-like domain-containing protein [Bacteroidota bacterium]